MIHWLWTAFSTYFLHFEHGKGYAFWSSGPGPGLGQVTLASGLVVLLVRHNCHTKGCWRIGRRSHEDLVLCHKHHPKDPPRAGEIK